MPRSSRPLRSPLRDTSYRLSDFSPRTPSTAESTPGSARPPTVPLTPLSVRGDGLSRGDAISRSDRSGSFSSFGSSASSRGSSGDYESWINVKRLGEVTPADFVEALAAHLKESRTAAPGGAPKLGVLPGRVDGGAAQEGLSSAALPSMALCAVTEECATISSSMPPLRETAAASSFGTCLAKQKPSDMRMGVKKLEGQSEAATQSPV
eukprot:TRINITY_DN3149_c0_g1_i1.p1 TRINITY_DN3149_c0_g1~~TRINITY_DN3149_c0_g1_i1.p1  ORF type:complete len:208 (+),score=35.38 TRINITY_DN3149_c0_g1_i1:339-962(+)